MKLDDIFHILLDSFKITLLVAAMMILVDFVNVRIKGKLSELAEKKGYKQYVLTNFLGAVPGCMGSYMNVSLYMHGMISFGALTGSMIATAGDEAFVLLAQLGWKAFGIIGILFLLGIAGSFISDKFAVWFKVEVAKNCKLQVYHEPHEQKKGHFIVEHIWNHLIKKHLIRIFLWTVFALMIIHLLENFIDIKNISEKYMVVILITAALIGLLPDSGPHLIFITLFAQGVVPFSVLLTSSIVQDGHGMLPMISFSIKDSVYIKIFNLGFGLFIGFLVYSFGYS